MVCTQMVANSPENYGTARYRGFNSSAHRHSSNLIICSNHDILMA